MKTRFTERFGVACPIVQAGMSWASSNPYLPAAVSNAGGLGVLAAGPMRLNDFRAALAALKSATGRPFAVNVPLYRPSADEVIDLALSEGVPILIGSQGGPKRYVEAARGAGVKTLHVVASPDHAQKAADLGVDGVIAVGGEAGGHPPPDQVSTLVLTRAIARALPDLPLVAAGGIADGAGIAAVMALGADAAQLGTRYLATREASVHAAYKQAVIEAGIGDTAVVGRGFGVIRTLRNTFADACLAQEQAGMDLEARRATFTAASLKQAALDGDIAGGKLEAGQSAGLVSDLPAAGDLTRRLMAECRASLARIAALAEG